MKEVTVTVNDEYGDLNLTREDLIKYTTKSNVIAAALMIRLSHYAFSLLSPREPVKRRLVCWKIGFPGPGILDCVEMLTHAVREGRCLQVPITNHPEAPYSLFGQFIFEVMYNGKTLSIWPDKSVFDDEFRQQVATWQDQDEHTLRNNEYLKFKADKVATIMSLPDEELFHTEWLTTVVKS